MRSKINIRNFSSRSGLLLVYQDVHSLEILSTHRTEKSHLLAAQRKWILCGSKCWEKISIQSIDNSAEVESAFALSTFMIRMMLVKTSKIGNDYLVF